MSSWLLALPASSKVPYELLALVKFKNWIYLIFVTLFERKEPASSLQAPF